MADKNDIDFIYTTLDEIFRLSIGENGDYSGALYNGDFSLTLEQAQRSKHEFIADQLNIRKGSRVLEMGSGWGPFLKFATQKREAEIIGLTLSDGQYEACKRHGFSCHIKDCREVTPRDFGRFGAIVSVGAFEHFCSVKEFEAGLQEEVYRKFFKTTADLLEDKGRFFLQTMTFTEKMAGLSKLDIHARKDSDEYLLALTAKHHPGSWLPYGAEMILRSAKPYFKVVTMNSGREDYIETIRQWRKRLRSFSFSKYLLYAKFLNGLVFRRNLRHLVDVFRISPIMQCFQRDLMNHYRIVLEKV